jgi:hypothetical protein
VALTATNKREACLRPCEVALGEMTQVGVYGRVFALLCRAHRNDRD